MPPAAGRQDEHAKRYYWNLGRRLIDGYSPLRAGLDRTLDLLFHRWRVRARWLASPLKSVFQDAVCMDVSLLLSADIDECADGFVECDSKSTCVNLPGWYHCECRDGYHDNGLFSTNGESCVGEWHQRIIMNPYNLFLTNWNPNSQITAPSLPLLSVMSQRASILSQVSENNHRQVLVPVSDATVCSFPFQTVGTSTKAAVQLFFAGCCKQRVTYFASLVFLHNELCGVKNPHAKVGVLLEIPEIIKNKWICFYCLNHPISWSFFFFNFCFL